ncbi:hypothetical protein [Conyzicola sp.]|uniref:hypothetical protein n=1 Tax=Conyzicola sp. TaxID=1969404 RepID=UPI003989F95B
MSRRQIYSRHRNVLAVGAGVAAVSLVALTAVAPPAPPTRGERIDAFLTDNAQSVAVPEGLAGSAVTRDAFSVTAGYTSLSAGGTNHDWAKLVLLYAEFPLSESNVTVFTRWMRQENGTDDWWNRNNPLNNGWGSGGGAGLGSYANLDIAAQNAAKALHGNPGYAAIVAGFETSAPTSQIEQAIWASPWATSHYANGAHWSSREVPVVTSPEGTW